MSDEDEHDHSLLDRYQHHLLDLYRNPFLTTSGRRRSAGGFSIFVVFALIYVVISEYWDNILVFLLPLAGILGSALLLGLLILIRTAPPPQVHEAAPILGQTARAEMQIRNTIKSTPKLGRYAWSDSELELLDQWRHFKETGQTPIRRKTLARKARQARKAGPETTPPQPPALSPEAQKILVQINASPRLSRHAWHQHETGLLEQWQRYQTHGQLPIRRSRLEKKILQRR